MTVKLSNLGLKGDQKLDLVGKRNDLDKASLREGGGICGGFPYGETYGANDGRSLRNG